MRNRSFIPWLVLSIPLVSVIDLIVRGDLNSLFAILTFSATVGVPLGLLMGVFAAVIRKSIELGIWIFVGSVLGCVLAPLTLLSLATIVTLSIDIFGGESTRTSGSSEVDNEGVARAVGEALLILGLLPVAILGGAIGGWLYYARDQHR